MDDYTTPSTIEICHMPKIADAEEYCAVLKKIIAQQPDNYLARNKLGVTLFAAKNWQPAIEQFQAAIKQAPDYLDGWYNLGLTFTKQTNLTQAVKTWLQLLEIAPEHAAARFHLGCCYMLQNQYALAENMFNIIIQKQPSHPESQHNLATCYLKQGAFKEARQHYLIALDLNPDDIDILFNLGVIAEKQNDLDLAIRYYQKLLQINPDFFSAHYNIAIAFMMKKHNEFAIDHFNVALRLDPDNQNIQYLIEMLSPQKNTTGAPAEYITTLFDAYADHYEQHLTQALDYILPKLFLATARKKLNLADNKLNILDLGCGTGLCGEQFKSFARILDGVDLSEKMLEVAREKNIFDSLTKSEILLFLNNNIEKYDLILAGDVLVYFGDLDNLFKKTYESLCANGNIIFNTEISNKKDFAMNQSGRFSHHEKYIKLLAKKYNFIIKNFSSIQSRRQNNQPVTGYLVVLQKNIASHNHD